MAEESLEAGGRLSSAFPRSSAIRYYYASFQAMTALLLYNRLTPPEGRGAWSHTETQKLLRMLEKIIPQASKRSDMRKRLVNLYSARLDADYISAEFNQENLTKIAKDAGYLVKVAMLTVS